MQAGADQTNVELVPRKTPRPRVRQHPDRRVESLGIVNCWMEHDIAKVSLNEKVEAACLSKAILTCLESMWAVLDAWSFCSQCSYSKDRRQR
jgi:hypothetical protein